MNAATTISEMIKKSRSSKAPRAANTPKTSKGPASYAYLTILDTTVSDSDGRIHVSLLFAKPPTPAAILNALDEDRSLIKHAEFKGIRKRVENSLNLWGLPNMEALKTHPNADEINAVQTDWVSTIVGKDGLYRCGGIRITLKRIN